MQNAESSHSLASGRIERKLGKTPAEWTLDDLVGLIRDAGIRLVSLMHVGGDGTLKTLDFVPRSERHLRDVLEAGERADGSNLFKGTGIQPGASDIVLRPRLHRAFLDPFSPVPTLTVLCEHCNRDGEPLVESPDTIVRKAHRRVRDKLGVDLWALGEVEYFIGKHAAEEDIYGKAEHGYHATAPFVFGEALRREALGILGDIGLSVKYGHSEVGYVEASDVDDVIWEQHEIELRLAPLNEAADAVALSQWVLRNLAHRRGFRLSFAPIVRVGHAGSGLHFHLSPMVDGHHAGGRGEDGNLEEPAQWLIGGLVRMGGALMAFGNREDGSFTRLTQGKEAPTSMTWGEFDRRALIRLPVRTRTAEGRMVSPPTVEFRLADGSAHAHLLLAGIAQAMIRGADTEDLTGLLSRTNAQHADVQPAGLSPVPRSFEQVVRELGRHHDALAEGGVFPEVLLSRIEQTGRV